MEGFNQGFCSVGFSFGHASTGNVLGLLADVVDYLRIAHHRGGVTPECGSKCPVEIGKPPGCILSFVFFIISYIEIIYNIIKELEM